MLIASTPLVIPREPEDDPNVTSCSFISVVTAKDLNNSANFSVIVSLEWGILVGTSDDVKREINDACVGAVCLIDIFIMSFTKF